MATFRVLFTLLSLFLAAASLAQGQQVNVKFSKPIMSPDDNEIILQCDSFGLQSNPHNIVVFASHGRILFNSSDSSQLAPMVSVINQTSIAYRNITNGASDIRCRINNTVSQSVTIPRVHYVSLQRSPSQFSMNSYFTIKCGYSISPNVTNNLVIGLHLNNTEVGQFTVSPFQESSFYIPNTVPGLSVQQGNETFSFLARATSPSAEGKYTCSLKVNVPMGSGTFVSNAWNTNSCRVVVPSVVLLLLAALFALGW